MDAVEVRLQLLGRFQARRDDAEVPPAAFGGRKVRAPCCGCSPCAAPTWCRTTRWPTRCGPTGCPPTPRPTSACSSTAPGARSAIRA